MSNNIYYCYSMNQKEFIELFGLKSLDNKPLIHPLTNKKYFRFDRNSELLEKALFRWKQNKIDAINLIKNKNNK